MILLDIVVCAVALFFGLNFNKKFKIFNNYDLKILGRLFVFHLLIGIFFYAYILSSRGDATSYWFVTGYSDFSFDDVLLKMKRSATGYLLLLNYFPARVLNLSFFTGSMLYTVLGYIGFVYFYAVLKENIPNFSLLKQVKILSVPVFPTLLFLPNLHFWSSGVGKDTLLFFCIAIFIFSMKNIKKRFLNILLAILLSLMVRPHITVFFIMAFGIGYSLDKKLQAYKKFFIFLIFIGGLVVMYDYVLQFVQLESLDSESIEKYSTNKVASLGRARTGSSIDTSSYSYPLKIFTFLYRPLFVDGLSVLNTVASFENLFLLLFTFKLLMNSPIKAFKDSSFLLKGIFVFFVLGSLSFSLILGNLGIMLRQKVPFIISLVIFGYWVLMYNKLYKKNKIKY